MDFMKIIYKNTISCILLDLSLLIVFSRVITTAKVDAPIENHERYERCNKESLNIFMDEQFQINMLFNHIVKKILRGIENDENNYNEDRIDKMVKIKIKNHPHLLKTYVRKEYSELVKKYRDIELKIANFFYEMKHNEYLLDTIVNNAIYNTIKLNTIEKEFRNVISKDLDEKNDLQNYIKNVFSAGTDEIFKMCKKEDEKIDGKIKGQCHHLKMALQIQLEKHKQVLLNEMFTLLASLNRSYQLKGESHQIICKNMEINKLLDELKRTSSMFRNIYLDYHIDVQSIFDESKNRLEKKKVEIYRQVYERIEFAALNLAKKVSEIQFYEKAKKIIFFNFEYNLDSVTFPKDEENFDIEAYKNRYLNTKTGILDTYTNNCFKELSECAENRIKNEQKTIVTDLDQNLCNILQALLENSGCKIE